MVELRKNTAGSIKRWWNGFYVPYENNPRSSLIFTGGHCQRHWSAKVARATLGFLHREWKWSIATLLAIMGLTMTYVRLF